MKLDKLPGTLTLALAAMLGCVIEGDDTGDETGGQDSSPPDTASMSAADDGDGGPADDGDGGPADDGDGGSADDDGGTTTAGPSDDGGSTGSADGDTDSADGMDTADSDDTGGLSPACSQLCDHTPTALDLQGDCVSLELMEIGGYPFTEDSCVAFAEAFEAGTATIEQCVTCYLDASVAPEHCSAAEDACFL